MQTNITEKTLTEKNKRKRRRTKHAINRHRHHAGRQAWRSAPATPAQLEALRTIAMETGHTYVVGGTTRGEAWKRIKVATVILDEQLRARCAPPWWTAAGRQSVRSDR